MLQQEYKSKVIDKYSNAFKFNEKYVLVYGRWAFVAPKRHFNASLDADSPPALKPVVLIYMFSISKLEKGDNKEIVWNK